jgi:hypothetical protein
MQTTPTRGLTTATSILTLAFVAALGLAQAPPARAQPASQTWIGSGSDPYWDAPRNWSTGTAPGGVLSDLVFPNNSGGCLSFDCGFSIDDIPGLAIGTLAIDPNENYLIVPTNTFNSLNISGGIAFTGATATPQRNAPLNTNLEVPLTLTAKQTWTLTGVPDAPSQLTLDSVSGPYPLTLNASTGTTLAAAALNTGPLTINGGGTVTVTQPTPGSLAATAPPPPAIIASPGVTLRGGASISFSRPGTLSGPVTVGRGSYTTIEVGDGTPPDATVTVNGDVTLRADTSIGFWLDGAATQGKKPLASTDYSHLAATGDIDLNNAALAISEGFAQRSNQCATLKGGQTYTVISAYGAINGTFAGIANNQVIPIGSCSWPNTASTYAALIRYGKGAVTATIIGAAQIKTLVTQTLTPCTFEPIATIRQQDGCTENFEAPATGTLTLTWTTTARRKRVTVASASNVANRVGPRPLAIKLTAAARTLLNAKQLALKATATFTPSAGNPIRASKRITLS